MGILEGILYMLWRGIAIGVIISAPMGPVGILCIQRTLAKGRKAGFYTGVGAACSDLFYCLLTGYGLSFIEEFLERNQNVIQIVGSVVLMAFAAYLFFSNPSRSIKKPGESDGSTKRDIINGFLFTVSNPLIIFLIIGLFARFNFMLPEILPGHYVLGFICIILGALGWWWMVTFFVDKVRAHFNLRSMWLVNKITGSIIAVFGVVGVITAITGLANAGVREPRYLNSSRGFGVLTQEGGSLLMIDGNRSDNPCALETGSGDFSVEFRARNLHNSQGKRYDATDGVSSWKERNPGWMIRFYGNDTDTLEIEVRTVDEVSDDYGPTSLVISACKGDSLCFETSLRDKLDWFDGWNAWRIHHIGNDWYLMAGNREYNRLGEWNIPGFNPDMMELCARPGALLEADWFKVEDFSPVEFHNSYMADPDVLQSYLQRSTDPMEGIWEVLDRTLEENSARPGGDYRLAIISNGQGYDLIYLSGAKVEADRWQPGALKGKLEKTSFKNIYDVTWLDAEGKPLETEVKCEFTPSSTLTFQLPYLSSSFRLRKTY